MSDGETQAFCSTPEARQFDVWLGKWDLPWGEGGKGRNVITKEYRGCVIQKKFSGQPGMDLLGMSVSTFDDKKGVWRQTWVDNNGSYLDLVGVFKDGKMMLVCEKDVEGEPVLSQMVSITSARMNWIGTGSARMITERIGNRAGISTTIGKA